MKKVAISLGLSLGVLGFTLGTVSCGGETKTEQVAAVKYQCPMDCEDGKTYEKEGSCPVCGMEIKPVESASSESEANGHSH